MNTVLVGISQEDADLSKAAGMHKSLGGELPFDIAYDVNREHSTAYDRVTAYLIDSKGIVQEIFPMTVRSRPAAAILVNEVANLYKRQIKAAAADDEMTKKH
ncbi:MAG: hypothetical protein ACI9EF_001080 [Pseudohongiellaceae bacterium]|jgi:hypothetical protein